jgi:hypothetical protein
MESKPYLSNTSQSGDDDPRHRIGCNRTLKRQNIRDCRANPLQILDIALGANDPHSIKTYAIGGIDTTRKAPTTLLSPESGSLACTPVQKAR